MGASHGCVTWVHHMGASHGCITWVHHMGFPSDTYLNLPVRLVSCPPPPCRLFDYSKRCQRAASAAVGTSCSDPSLPNTDAAMQHCSNNSTAVAGGTFGQTSLPCGPASLAVYLVTDGLLLCAVGFVALLGAAIIMIKYQKRMGAAAAGAKPQQQQQQGGSFPMASSVTPGEGGGGGGRDGKEAASTAYPPPAAPLATLGVHIPEALSALLRRFAALLDSAADVVSEGFALKAACLPVATFYFIYTIVSRFADDKVCPVLPT